MTYSEKEVKRQRRRLETLEAVEQSLIKSISEFNSRECNVEDNDLFKGTVQLELRLKKRIAEVSARLMYMIQQEEFKEEIA